MGNFKNNGVEYQKKETPIKVSDHDFPLKGKTTPYGVYDIAENKDFVSVGISNDTAGFASNSILRWWEPVGKSAYPNATKIMITADCGGSNGNRVKLWKVKLQEIANQLNPAVYVTRFPPGTSKWNKIEHRLFSCIREPLKTLFQMEFSVVNPVPIRVAYRKNGIFRYSHKYYSILT